MPLKCLVTGGAGFIGSHLVRALLERGDAVRVLDNLSTGKLSNLEEIKSDIELIVEDLRDSDICLKACEGMDAVFHLGALGSVPRSIEDPFTSNAVNVGGSLHILDAARRGGVKRVVFSSSSSVYGSNPILPKQEDMRPLPRSPYAVSKLAGETYCQAFYASYGLEAVALRYFNVFGPRQSPDSQYAAVIPRFIAALAEGRAPAIYGDGEQSRDFTYVVNVVNANILAASAPDSPGKVFNIACGEQITVNALLAGIADRMGCKFEAEYLPERAGDVRHSRADITAAQTTLGYQPSVFFNEGLDRTVKALSSELSCS